MSCTLVFSCLHTPYQHPDALRFLKKVAKAYKPTRVVNLGDEIDSHALSNYDVDPDAKGATDELKASIATLKPLYTLFPHVYCCESNHTWRVYRKANRAGIPRRCIKSINEILEAPSTWRWQESWTLDGVFFTHGDGFSGVHATQRAVDRYRHSVALGHVHSAAGVYYSRNAIDTVFGLSVGCLVDETSPAMSYSRGSVAKAVLGCGVIKNGVPVFIPFE